MGSIASMAFNPAWAAGRSVKCMGCQRIPRESIHACVECATAESSFFEALVGEKCFPTYVLHSATFLWPLSRLSLSRLSSKCNSCASCPSCYDCTPEDAPEQH